MARVCPEFEVYLFLVGRVLMRTKHGRLNWLPFSIAPCWLSCARMCAGLKSFRPLTRLRWLRQALPAELPLALAVGRLLKASDVFLMPRGLRLHRFQHLVQLLAAPRPQH